MFAESKDEISLVLFGTADTANDLSTGGEAYANISIARPLAPVDWDLLQYIERDLKPGNMPADCILNPVNCFFTLFVEYRYIVEFYSFFYRYLCV